MSLLQKRTLLLLALIGLAYFGLFIIPNARGARDENMLLVFSHDETITYPYVMHMLETPKDIHDFAWRMLIYGDYHYGYPFYFFSMLAALPVKLIYGEAFTAHTQLSLLLLRQLISVLPMILAAGVLVYAQTRFCSPWRSAGLFVLMLIVPGVVRQNMWWWHPDALAVLCVALTLLFLTLDRLRLGRFFFLAALACGLSIALKLVGFFFVFALAGYVLAALWQKRLAAGQAIRPQRTTNSLGWVALRSVAFIGVMALAVLLSNPFLFYASQRAKMLRIQAQKTVELSQGYAHDDPTYYQKGPTWWQDTLEKWYGPAAFLALLVGLLTLGSLRGEHQLANRLMLAWVIPYSIYLLYFVAVKPDHYWLPVMLPLFSGALNVIQPAEQGKYRRVWLGLSALVLLVLVWQGLHFVQADAAQYLTVLGREAAQGY